MGLPLLLLLRRLDVGLLGNTRLEVDVVSQV